MGPYHRFLTLSSITIAFLHSQAIPSFLTLSRLVFGSAHGDGGFAGALQQDWVVDNIICDYPIGGFGDSPSELASPCFLAQHSASTFFGSSRSRVSVLNGHILGLMTSDFRIRPSFLPFYTSRIAYNFTTLKDFLQS